MFAAGRWMMFVWWAVFFFAGSLVPGGFAGALTALGTASILTLLPVKSSAELRSRFFLICASGLFVLASASLSPIDIDILTGSSRPASPRVVSFPPPVRTVRDGMLSLTDDRRLTDETRSLLRALLVADRKSLPMNIRRDFQKTGTAHYLALSGLHLGLIAVPLFAILSLSGARGLVRDVSALFALSFYAAVAGRPGSLLRALSMMTVIRTYRLAGIRSGLGQSVIAGAFLVCILDPGSLSDTGFLLSFNAAAGVALLGVPACTSIQRHLAGKRGSRMITIPLLALSMSFCVQLAMLPLSVRIFGFAPLSGPVMSVLLSLPVTFLLYGGFLYIIAGHLCASVAAPPLNMLTALAVGIVSRGAEISRAGLIITDFDIRIYIPGLIMTALALRSGASGKWMLTTGMLIIVLSFGPLLTGEMDDEEAVLSITDRGARLFGGNNGVLVLDECPASWSVPYLSRDLRRSGLRKIEAVVILGAEGFDAEGLTSLAGDLGPERIFLSPWLYGECPGIIECIFVKTDTVLVWGNGRLSVNAPAIPPGRGARADRKESSLTISLLD
jgi:ComEC/Rec2-related protein